MYPLEVKARAIQLLQEGYGTPTVERRLREELGAGPDHSTIAEWRNQAEITRMIRTQNEELAIRYGRLMHKAADHLDTLPASELAKPQMLNTLNVAHGTNVDKIQRDAQPATAAQQFVLVKAEPGSNVTVEHSANHADRQIVFTDTQSAQNGELSG